MDEFYDPAESVVTWEDGTPWGCGYEPPSPEPVDFDYYYNEETYLQKQHPHPLGSAAYKRELEEQMKEVERQVIGKVLRR